MIQFVISLIFDANLDRREAFAYKIVKRGCFEANVAQLVEQRFRKPQVVGSIPTVGSSFLNMIRAAAATAGRIQFGRARRGGSGSL